MKGLLSLPPRLVRRAAVLAAGLALVVLGACSASEDGTSGCPILCPSQKIALIDTTFDAVTFDSTLSSFPALGADTSMLLATMPGDSLDVRGFTRYDSVNAKYAPTGLDTLRRVTNPDSMRFVVKIDTSKSRASAAITLEAYDVDSTGVDTATRSLLPLFRPANLLATKTFRLDSLFADSLIVPINGPKLATLFARDTGRVRVGWRIRSSAPAFLRLGTNDDTRPTKLVYRPAPDSGQPTYTFGPTSQTPVDVPSVAGALADYTYTFSTPASARPQTVAVGGAPGNRTYMGFSIPSAIVDSTSVVRASLILTQAPVGGPQGNDTVYVSPFVIVSAQLNDYYRMSSNALPYSLSAARQAAGPRGFTDSLAIVPRDSGQRLFDITAVFREWKASGPAGVPRAVVLRSNTEGLSTAQVRFFSRAAAAGLRPRLRLVYTAKPGTGLP